MSREQRTLSSTMSKLSLMFYRLPRTFTYINNNHTLHHIFVATFRLTKNKRTNMLSNLILNFGIL